MGVCAGLVVHDALAVCLVPTVFCAPSGRRFVLGGSSARACGAFAARAVSAASTRSGVVGIHYGNGNEQEIDDEHG